MGVVELGFQFQRTDGQLLPYAAFNDLGDGRGIWTGPAPSFIHAHILSTKVHQVPGKNPHVHNDGILSGQVVSAAKFRSLGVRMDRQSRTTQREGSSGWALCKVRFRGVNAVKDMEIQASNPQVWLKR